ncbi:MAG: hypothetical protein KC931_19300 [Candidatus Omnitrophica bacterium]|nr:hypothetical protein [Candidatus Omnitrophota bacterium]
MLRLRLWLWKGSVRQAVTKNWLKPFVLGITGAGFLVLETYLFYRLFEFLFNEVQAPVQAISRALSLHLLNLFFLVFFAMLLYSNLITALSVFITANDMKVLLVYPIRNRWLYLSKIVETLTRSSLTLSVFLIPALATYGHARGVDWVYYAWIIPLIVTFMIIPGSIAVPFMLILARIFPTKRLQQGLIALGLVITTAGLFAFRLLRVEDIFSTATSAEQLQRWAQAFQIPDWGWLPNGLVVKTVDGLAESSTVDPAAWRLVVMAVCALAVSTAIGAPFIRGTWSRSFGTNRKNLGRFRLLQFGKFRIPGLKRGDSAMVLKELKVFSRDLSRWSQMVMMIPLLGFYLLNMHLLPFREQFQGLYYLVNLFMIAFMVAAIGARYLFPSISWEGPALWLVRVSPYSVWRLVVIKFIFLTAPLMVLTWALTVLSYWILGFDHDSLSVSLWMALGTTLFLGALAVGFGAILPRFRYEHHLEISLGPGGLLYMLTAFGVSFGYAAVLGYPMFVEMTQQSTYWGHWSFSNLVPPTVEIRNAWLMICFGGTLMALYVGVVSLSRREEFDR